MENHYFITSTAYSISERKTKKGIVYDVIFRAYKDINGAPIQKKLCGYETRRLAQRAHTDFVTRHCTLIEKAPRPDKQRIIYDDAYNQWIGCAEGSLREGTIYSFVSTFKTFITPYFTKKNLATLTKNDFYEWQDTLWKLKKPNGELYSFATLKRVRLYFNNFLNWCYRRYDIRNILASIPIPKRNEAQHEMLFWERHEFEQFISVVDDIKWRTLFMTLYYSGCRIGEAMALSDNDYTGKSLKISKTLTTKVRGAQRYLINGRKNKRLLEVPLPQKLIRQLDEYLEWKKQHDISSEFLFGGDAPLAHSTIRRKFSEFASAAGVKQIRIHDLRHSYVSLLIHTGANYTVIAELIGDNKEQVVKTYGHMYPNDKVAAVSLID